MEIEKINGFIIKALNKELAQKYLSELTSLANLIPLARYSEIEILAEQKEDRKFFENGNTVMRCLIIKNS